MAKEREEKKESADTTVANRDWYTQREWDRCVGYDTVPDNYKNPLTESKQ